MAWFRLQQFDGVVLNWDEIDNVMKEENHKLGYKYFQGGPMLEHAPLCYCYWCVRECVVHHIKKKKECENSKCDLTDPLKEEHNVILRITMYKSIHLKVKVL